VPVTFANASLTAFSSRASAAGRLAAKVSRKNVRTGAKLRWCMIVLLIISFGSADSLTGATADGQSEAAPGCVGKVHGSFLSRSFSPSL